MSNLREISKSELEEVLKRHQMWLDGVEGGVRANLSGVNLSGVNLVRANLVRANLEGANLFRANLFSTNLERANLKLANLKWANLFGAYLFGANLEGCTIWSTIGNGREIKTIQTEKYTINYTTDKIIQIGCENHTSEEWFSFSDERISQMDDGALKFWNDYKTILEKLIELNSNN